MTQSRLASLVEAAGNTASGFLISLAMQAGINLAYGLPLGLHDDLVIVAVFTATSLARTYCWRRLMNRLARPRPRDGRACRIKIIQPAAWPGTLPPDAAP